MFIKERVVRRQDRGNHYNMIPLSYDTDYYHTKASGPQNKLIKNATLKSRVKSAK